MQIERKLMKTAITMLSSVVETRSRIPVLTCLAMDASSGGALRITGTDLDIYLTTVLPAAQCETRQGLVQMNALKRMLDMNPASIVDLCLAGEGVNIDGMESNPGFSWDDFPAPLGQDAEQDGVLHWKASQLKEEMKFVKSAINPDDSRFYLNGVFFDTPNGALVATDGDRMRISTRLPIAGYSFILPRKAVAVLLKAMAASKTEDVLFSWRGKKVCFTGAGGLFGFSLQTKTIDGSYPDYRRIIDSARNMPGNGGYAVEFDSAVWREALKPVPVPKGKAGKPIVLRFAPTSVEAVFEPEGMSKITVPLPLWPDTLPVLGKGPAAVGFNAKYLKEALEGHEGRTKIIFADPASPAIIEADGPDGRTTVVMPMWVKA